MDAASFIAATPFMAATLANRNRLLNKTIE
jgi:hypothetical protein